MAKSHISTKDFIALIVAILGMIGVMGTAYLTYRGMTDPGKLSLSATQTAETRLLVQLQLSPPTLAPTQTSIPTLTAAATTTPILAPSFTPTPALVVDTRTDSEWTHSFDKSNSTGRNDLQAIDRTIHFSYAIGKDGFVIITKKVDNHALAGTSGIRFTYKGSGAPNTIEIKISVLYPGTANEVTYSTWWNSATDTKDEWVEKEAFYTAMTCSPDDPNCIAIEGNDLFDPTRIKKLDFAVSNKPGDEPGSGLIVIKDVFGIKP